jgi:membrane fusion protein (multidrug efflux system)
MAVWKQFFVLLVIAALGAGGYKAYLKYMPPPETGSAKGGAREIAVEVAEAEIRALKRTVEAVGTTRARQSIQIVPLASGRVVDIAFTPGQHVDAGAVLVRLDDDIELADLAEAEAKLVEQRQAVERAVQLQRTNAVSMAILEQVTAAKAAADAEVFRAKRRLDDRVIRAPFTGVVGLTDTSLGARVDDATVLTTLDDISEVEVQFSLPETLFAEIAPGQPVSARSAAFTGRDFAGSVGSIDTRIDPVSRAFKVRAVIPNPEGVLPSGMFMSLTLTLSEAEALMVPEEAIVVQAAETYVFVVEDGRASRRTVVTGQRRDGAVAVLSGLEPGETVLVRGLQRVRDGSPVKIVGTAAPAVEAATAAAPSNGATQ